jgi:serralysin
VANFYGTDIDDVVTTATHSELYGGAGNDVFKASTPGFLYMEGGSGDDVLEIEISDSFGTLYGGDGADHLYGSGFGSVSDHLYGGAGDDYITGSQYPDQEAPDVLDGGPGNDFLIGSGLNDTFYGGDGDDLISGVGGNDVFVGGSGNDSYFIYLNAGATIVEAASGGTDGVATYSNVTLPQFAEIEFLESLEFNDSGPSVTGLTLIGSNTPNTITGDSGANVLSGLGGSDVVKGLAGDDLIDGGLDADMLDGGDGDDRLLGGGGLDTLLGLAGNDRLLGGAGKDTLTGGTGRDTFVFNTAPNKTTNVDRIADFARVDDTFHLDNAYLKKVGSNGKLKSDAFHLGKKAADAEDRVIYDKSTGNLFYDADGTGKIAAIKIAVLQNKALIGLSDFVII